MNRPFRILELRSVWGPGGGPEKTILHGAARADRSRWQVTVCYLRDQRDPVFQIGPKARGLGIDYVELVERHSFDLGIWRDLRRIVRDRRIDLVHAHEYKTDLLSLWLARVERVIPLATVHGWSGLSWAEWFYYLIDKRLLRRFPHVVAVSRQIAAELSRVGVALDRISVLHNGIDPGVYRRRPDLPDTLRSTLGWGPVHYVIGAVGRLESEKCYHLLIEAFARVHQRFPITRLVIAGEGSQRDRLERCAQSHGLRDQVRLIGHCEDIIGFYQSVNLFVQSSDREGTSNAVLEAMAMETPIVATNVGGTGEILAADKEGLLVPPLDPGALAQAIIEVIEDPVRAAGRVQVARKRVESELSFSGRQAKLEAIYERLLSEAGQGHA